MNCDETRLRIGDLIDGALSPAEASSMERHLAACAVCRAELDELRRALAAVSELPGKHAPRGFAAGVTEQIQWNDRIAAYADGALSAGEAAAVEQHLAAHAEAREELADLRKTAEALKALPKLKAPAGFAFRVMAEVMPGAATSERRDNVIPISRATMFLRVLGSVAAILLVYVGLANLPQRRVPPVDSATAKEEVKAGDFRRKAAGLPGEGAAVDDKHADSPPETSSWSGAGDPQLPVKPDVTNNPDPSGFGSPQDAAKPDRPVDKGGMSAGMAAKAANGKRNAVHRISVASKDVAVDSQRVRDLLSDAGFTWSAQGDNRVVMVRVSNSRAREILAALSETTAGKLDDQTFKDADSRDARELEKLKSEEQKREELAKEALVRLDGVDRLESSLKGQVEETLQLLAKTSKLRERNADIRKGGADRGLGYSGDEKSDHNESDVSRNESGGVAAGNEAGRAKAQGLSEEEEAKTYGAGLRGGADSEGKELAEHKAKQGENGAKDPSAAGEPAISAGAGGGTNPRPAQLPPSAPAGAKKEDPAPQEKSNTDKSVQDELAPDGKSQGLKKTKDGKGEFLKLEDEGADEGVILVIEFAEMPFPPPADKPAK